MFWFKFNKFYFLPTWSYGSRQRDTTSGDREIILDNLVLYWLTILGGGGGGAACVGICQTNKTLLILTETSVFIILQAAYCVNNSGLRRIQF